MNTTYIIKNNEIYEVTSEDKATKISIVNGVAKKTKETIEYDAANDFPYAFFEIRAKFADLFQVPEEVEEVKKEIPLEKPKNKSKDLEKSADDSEE